MLNKLEIARYNRHLILSDFGIESQEKLKAAKVLIIGAGGLGCPALLYLTAAGIGEIGLIDDDKIEESNLQRQILFSVEDIGKLKSVVAAEKLRKQNPFVTIKEFSIRLTNLNALDLFAYYDIIVDGTDNYSTRYLVNDACVILNKTLVYGSIYKFEGQVAVFNHKQNSGLNSCTYRCVFPNPPHAGTVPNCSEIGVLGVLPGIIGCLQATEVIKLVTGIGEPLCDKLLFFDALSMNSTILNTERNTNWENQSPRSREEYLKTDYEVLCGMKNNVQTKAVSITEALEYLHDKENYQFLDVRENNEIPIVEELIDTQIPLSEITQQTNRISKSKKVIVFCKSGVRSKLAIAALEKENGFTNLYNLEGGVNAFLQQNRK